ncbi:DinB family protein [Flavobacterium salmonis]|uniref:Damage-inducible protein DinB n=1 Tax=Flavobacterium salmonis TaxID=2654844 RepID=A0A6V6YSB0_9FLAO|nr:DinB family protein [Flavobacterium salmonis]CAD0002408.1 damage-inducible protein DinB [Flavobacterium salmonis]
MTKIYRQGAIGALLDEYERAIIDLQQVIADISDNQLIAIIHHKTTDANCESVQTVLAHVVSSGFAYAMDIRQHLGEEVDYPDDVLHLTVNDFHKDLNSCFKFMAETFKNIQDNQLEEFDNEKKIITPWRQVYDIEQITEHAIVHILRHRRQIEKFKIIIDTLK